VFSIFTRLTGRDGRRRCLTLAFALDKENELPNIRKINAFIANSRLPFHPDLILRNI